MSRSTGAVDRAISPVVGSVILIAIVIALVVTFGVVLVGFTEDVPQDTANLYVEMEETDAGLRVTPRVIDHPIDVRINGVTIMTIDSGDAHDPFLLPVAPEDDVHFVADVGRHQLLKQRHVDETEAGDFIAYYTFEKGGGSTVPDRSPNDNDATIDGATWVEDDGETGLAFDGTDDYTKVDQLNLNATVSEFTVAIEYRITGDTGAIQQLVEHRNDTTNFEWFVETDSANVPYRLHYTVWPDGNQQPGVTTGQLGSGETHVVVGTYNGSTLNLYLDGTYVGSKDVSDGIEMGALYLGADAVGASSQHLDGRIYQFRLYYTAFDADDVDVLTSVMEAEAE